MALRQEVLGFAEVGRLKSIIRRRMKNAPERGVLWRKIRFWR